ncbi:MAG: hypothetical protein ABJD07_11160 [Gemmatimonadaceae bacterium]
MERTNDSSAIGPAMKLFVLSNTALALVLCAPSMLRAQRADSARVAVATPARAVVADSLRPPFTPAKAFLHSLLLPGWSQYRFHRKKATLLFGIVEVGAMAMMIKSRLALNSARREAHDSIAGLDSTFLPPVPIRIHVISGVLSSRKQQVEDWTAILVFNHLFAGADAFVAANLWDFPAQIGIQPAPAGGSAIAARIRW